MRPSGLKLNQSGSVLIQAMMGLGFVGLISYSVMSYQSHSSRENKTQLAQNEIDSAAQVLSSLAAVPNLCNSNIFLRNNFVRPANIVTQPAVDQELAIATGSPTTARAAWVDGVMGAQAATSVPGTITAFNLSIDRIAISGARFKRNTTSTNELWAGDIVVSAQKPNPGAPSVTGKRIIGSMELEINAAGQKVNCSTSTSVASICRDLGGVYDALGVPNCVFALQPMDCSSLVDGYVHDVVGGAPVCRSARFVCPAGYFAAGITEGALDCIRLSRRIVYSTPPAPACTGGATTVVSSVPATPAGCYCTSTQTWDGTACTPPITCTGGATTTVTAIPATPVGCYCPTGQSWNAGTSTCQTPAVACYWREERTPSAPCDTASIDYGMDATCGGPHPPTSCGSVAGPAFQCRPAYVGSPEATTVCGSPPPPPPPMTCTEYEGPACTSVGQVLYTVPNSEHCPSGSGFQTSSYVCAQKPNSDWYTTRQCPAVPVMGTLAGNYDPDPPCYVSSTPPPANQVNTYLNEPFNPNYPQCGGVPIETMNPEIEIGPAPTFTVKNYIPPMPAGAQCVSMTNVGTFVVEFNYTFYSGPIVITGGFQPPGSLTTFVPGTCEPSGTTLPGRAKECTANGTTAYCCGGAFTCVANKAVCN
jgi:hypothetical protein